LEKQRQNINTGGLKCQEETELDQMDLVRERAEASAFAMDTIAPDIPLAVDVEWGWGWEWDAASVADMVVEWDGVPHGADVRFFTTNPLRE
jgi:hypothetical protein